MSHKLPYQSLSRLMFVLLLSAGCGSGGGGSSRDVGSFAREEVAVGDGEGALQVSWDEPTLHEDGTPISGTLEFNLHYQNDSGTEAQIISVGQTNSVLLRGLRNGSFAFAVTAVETNGYESSLSDWKTVALP
ncbi:MAG: hypothetical protein U0136_18470 [Bdellovibrionota bacterium]